MTPHDHITRQLDSHSEGDVIAHKGVRQRRSQRRSIGLNLTAMIDVVFLLLIYFMVATEFKLGEEVYRLDLPANLQSNQTRDPFDLDDEPLRIEVASVGLGANAYRIRIDGPYTQPASFDELSAFLRQSQIGPETGGSLFPTDHPIVVIPTASARWEHAMEAFNSAARHRYTNIIFAQAQ